MNSVDMKIAIMREKLKDQKVTIIDPDNEYQKLNIVTFATSGEGKECKSLKVWCEKEFGISVPIELQEDYKLYTYQEVTRLLKPFLNESK